MAVKHITPIVHLEPKYIERFWSRIDIRGEDECWNWTAAKTLQGVGALWVNGRNLYAPRIAYFLEHGKSADNFVCHHCDNRTCCNPKHIYDGTHADNMRDRQVRCRTNSDFGEQNGGHKLTTQSILEIRRRRADGESRAAIAIEFGVCKQTITKITGRRCWSHLP